jgi:lipopolysaccharide export system permease protein
VRILSRYFVARFVGLFTTVLLAALILIAAIELVLNLDDISSFDSTDPASGLSSGRGIAALHYLWIRLASYYLPDLFPIASFAAAFIALAWAGRAMELVAIQAAGIRLSRIVAPILATALILSVASAILHETVILRAHQSSSARFRSETEEIDFGRQAFWYHKGRTITNVSKADAATRMLYGVEVFERGEGGTVVRVIRAERIRIAEDGVWQIENAQIWNFDPDAPGAPPEFKENVSMALDLGAMRGDALLGAEPSLLPIRSLADYLEARPQESGAAHRRLMNRYHERLSQPWLVLLFAFLALPFGLRVDQTGRFVRRALEAGAVLGLFFLLRSAGMTLAQQELFPLGFTPWASIGLFAIASAVALRKCGL